MPNVRDCQPACIFGEKEVTGDKETNDYWCLEFTTPHIELGWEFEQKFTTTSTAPIVKYHQFQVVLYGQGYFYMKSLFDVNRFFFDEVLVDMPKFKFKTFFSQIFNSDLKYCWGVGWENDEISLNIQQDMRLMDCYKNLIYDICSTDGVWTGPTAKIFEKCEKSDEGNNYRRADYTTWKFLPQQADMMLAGTVSPASWDHCLCLPGLTSNCNKATARPDGQFHPVGAVENMAYNFYTGIGTYLWDTYHSKGAIDMWPLGKASLF